MRGVIPFHRKPTAGESTQIATLRLKNGKIVRLAFHSGQEGSVVVRAVDEKGGLLHCGKLILFCSEGNIHLMAGVNSTLGFQLNGDHSIKEY